ncbi:MAG: acylphosphatase [Pseudomonadota bacterium]
MRQQERIRVVVSGRVQGVFYRASTQEAATSLGVTGWVRNLDNGDVEFEAQGTPDQLQQLLQWAQRGPARALVTGLSQETCPLQQHEHRFEVRR